MHHYAQPLQKLWPWYNIKAMTLPKDYWKDRNAQRRKDPAYREAQRQWFKDWYARHGKDPARLKRKAGQQRKYANDPLLRMKHEARWQTHRAIKSGKLKRAPCVQCGAAKAEAHHADYYKPLEITWLCKECHRMEHAKAKGEA